MRSEATNTKRLEILLKNDLLKFVIKKPKRFEGEISFFHFLYKISFRYLKVKNLFTLVASVILTFK